MIRAEEIWCMPILTPIEKLILIPIYSGNFAFTNEFLSASLGESEEIIIQAILRLIYLGFIERIPEEDLPENSFKTRRHFRPRNPKIFLEHYHMKNAFFYVSTTLGIDISVDTEDDEKLMQELDKLEEKAIDAVS
jgi:hypothetical protein